MRKKNSIQIGHNDFLYPIFKELNQFRISEINFNDSEKQNGISRSIGIKIKDLRDNGLIYPPMTPEKHKTILVIPKEISIIERKGINISTFILNKK